MNPSDQQLTLFGLPLPYITLVIAGIAVLVAMVSIFYTRKTFQATNIPDLEIVLTNMAKVRLVQTHFPFRTQEFGFRLTNLHSSTYITDLKMSFAVADPVKGWRFWKKQWLIFAEAAQGNLHSIPPKQSIEVPIRPNDSFEKRLACLLPYVVKEVNANSPTYPQMTTYQFTRPYDLRLKLTVAYRPAMPSAGFRVKTQTYLLHPECLKDQGYDGFLKDWFQPERIT